ncbi:GNAT family N-acetyltransferase [Aeromonas diversa]|uniref:GNAT family N-acetyltransferase n=1 Tax=Aeromonas diversa TaxID=502790 RepID=UPI0039A36032
MMTNDFRWARYGVTLTPLRQEEIEMVRGWRNDPKIASLMLDQRHITAEMQQAWFERLQASRRDAYYLCWFKDKPIGVASLTCIDKDEGSCEPGMYIYADEYRSNLVPFCVAFALNDLAFEHFGLSRLLGKIFDDNTASVRFHQASGYVRYATGEQGIGLYQLEHGAYLTARAQITRFIRY